MAIPRIAASTYLNSFPLCYSFLYGAQRDRCEFVGDISPARCAELLKSGAVDAALIPSIEYQRIPDLELVPGIAVASRDDVRSVVLLSHHPLAEARLVALDPKSRTSVVLTRILFHRFLQQDVEFRDALPDLEQTLEEADAVLLIGDPALRKAAHPGRLRVYDLARLWKNHTGFPFAFAFWAKRRSALERLNAIDFRSARAEGLAALDRILPERARELELDVDYLRAYLTDGITYDLTPEHLRSLDLFYSLARELGLIEHIVPANDLEQVTR
ncbi:MAG: menaquinone biosynthesis protein [Acidobacteria bacterium]|nr:menaquinone biosynthesis protein [Acidobacteriota bacterium]